MRKQYTTISISRDLFEKIEETIEENPFYASVGEFVRRAIFNSCKELKK